MKKTRRLMRLWKIYTIILRYGLDEYVLAVPYLRTFHFLYYLNPYRIRHRPKTRGARIREALEKLGPIYVKFGQALSTRRDLLPEDIANELVKLQDQVPPFSGVEAQKIVEKAFGMPIESIFKSFSQKPLAAASIAQVHEAILFNGKEVIVKILRPGVQKKIDSDVDVMYFVARLAEKYIAESRRLHPVEVVAEFDQTIHDELDLQREAANASQLKRNFEGSDLLYVPEVHWDYVRQNIMVMEKISGIPVADIAALNAAGIDLKALAERGVEIFFTQVFRDCFFHADMHPGNIFVSSEHKDLPKYLGIDFGIMGTLTSSDQRYLAENLLAFFHRDYRRVAELHVESGWVPKDTRVDLFEAAIRTVCEPIFEKPLSQISFGQVLLRFFQTARRFNMEIQPQLILLQKTLFNVEGLGRQLYPDLDLWHTAKPYLEKWIRDQVGPKAFLRKVKRNMPLWLEKLPDIPELIHNRLQQQDTQLPEIVRQQQQQINLLTKQNKILVLGMSLFGLVVLAVLLQNVYSLLY